MKNASQSHEIVTSALCPFCGLPIEKPHDIQTGRPVQMPIGHCADCGAVYAYDVTGHNLGSAFAEALVVACNMDWDLAWDLLPDQDYLQKIVEKYDVETHSIIPGGVYQGRRTVGALYFVRMNQDIQEVTREGVERTLTTASISTKPTVSIKCKVFSKQDVEDLVRTYHIEPLLSVAGQDTRLIRYLQRLLCTSDELLRLRAADTIGQVCRLVVLIDPAPVTALLQGLFSSLSNSSASSWGSIDAIGELIANCPESFAGYIPTLYRLLEDPLLQPMTLRAIARIARAKPNLVRKGIPHITRFLLHQDPQIRGYALSAVSNLETNIPLEHFSTLGGNDTEIGIYAEGQIHKTTIANMIAEISRKANLP